MQRPSTARAPDLPRPSGVLVSQTSQLNNRDCNSFPLSALHPSPSSTTLSFAGERRGKKAIAMTTHPHHLPWSHSLGPSPSLPTPFYRRRSDCPIVYERTNPLKQGRRRRRAKQASLCSTVGNIIFFLLLMWQSQQVNWRNIYKVSCCS